MRGLNIPYSSCAINSRDLKGVARSAEHVSNTWHNFPNRRYLIVSCPPYSLHFFFYYSLNLERIFLTISPAFSQHHEGQKRQHRIIGFVCNVSYCLSPDDECHECFSRHWPGAKHALARVKSLFYKRLRHLGVIYELARECMCVPLQIYNVDLIIASRDKRSSHLCGLGVRSLLELLGKINVYTSNITYLVWHILNIRELNNR